MDPYHKNDQRRNILTEKDRGVSTARNVLARLFRQILRDLKIDDTRWSKLMVRYLLDPANGIRPNNRSKSYTRGNMNKELRRPSMTWKVFNDKAIPFLNPIKIKFVVELTWANKQTTVHELQINREDMQPDESEDEEGSVEGNEDQTS